MKRLTKSDCSYVASKLTKQAFDKKIEKAVKEEAFYGDYLVRQFIPKKVLECQNKYRDFFCSKGKVIVIRTNNECLYDRIIHLTTNIENPVGSQKYFFVSDEIYKKAKQLSDKVTNLQEKRRKYFKDVSIALYQLRTKKHIEEQFPEALSYLKFDDEKKNLPISQYTELRNMLK